MNPLKQAKCSPKLDQFRKRSGVHNMGPSIFSGAEIDLEEFLDLAQHPLHDLSSAKRQSLVESCRQQLDHDGCCVVRNLIKASAIDSMCDEATQLMDHVARNSNLHNPYFEPEDSSLPADHPKRRMQHRTNTFISAYLLNPLSLLRKFYASDVVLHF